MKIFRQNNMENRRRPLNCAWYCFLFLTMLFALQSRAQELRPADSPATHPLDISIAWGPSLGPTVGNYARFLDERGYTERSGPYGPDGSPYGPESGVGLSVTAQYFISPRFAVGAAIATLGDFAGNPARINRDSPQNYTQDYIVEENHSIGFYVTATYLVPASLLDKLGATLKLTSGLGINREGASHSVSIDEYFTAAAKSYHWLEKWAESEDSFSALFAAGLEFHITEELGIGVNTVYRYVPRGTLAAHSFQMKLDDGTLHHTFSLPAVDPNFSDWNIGMCMTLHLF